MSSFQLPVGIDLREAIAGRINGVPRAHAVALLHISGLADHEQILSRLLADENEENAVRLAAALYLWKANSISARASLIQTIRSRDEGVLTSVFKYLGRIGDEGTLQLIEATRPHATGLAAEAAEFAASLISYRLSLPGHVLRFPEESQFLQLDPTSSSVRVVVIEKAVPVDVSACLRALASQPYGIEFAADGGYRIQCGRQISIFLLNKSLMLPQAAAEFTTRKLVLGVIATFIEQEKTYEVVQLVLSSPARRGAGIYIHICRASGSMVMAGTGHVESGGVKLHIRAIHQPGAFPVHFEGQFSNGQLTFSVARTGLTAVPKRQPLPFQPPKQH